MPVSHSPNRPPAASGVSSGSPRPPVEPHAACSVNSVAGRPTQGPSVPKALIVTTTWLGADRRASDTANSPPATTMSAERTATPSWPACTDRLEVCR